MTIALTIIQTLLSVALILVVLFQSGKEEGLSGALAGNSGNSYLSKNKGNDLEQLCAKSTKWIALAWVLITLALCIFSA